jgi:hypothetical protein
LDGTAERERYMERNSKMEEKTLRPQPRPEILAPGSALAPPAPPTAQTTLMQVPELGADDPLYVANQFIRAATAAGELTLRFASPEPVRLRQIVANVYAN